MQKLKTQACSTCGGSGSMPADDVGPILREEREKEGITRKVLAGEMNISEGYLKDLEGGHRRWTNELLASYQKKLGELSNATV